MLHGNIQGMGRSRIRSTTGIEAARTRPARALAGPFAYLPVVLAALSALTGGCAQGSDENHLHESHWRFVLIDGQVPVSDAADLTFSRDRIGIVVGCNRMGGPWRLDGDRLIAGPLAQSEMTCPVPAWQQEKAVGALIASTPRMLLEEDRMTLQSSGHTAQLQRVDRQD